MTPFLLPYAGWVLLFSRLVVGVVMVFYGWPKITSLHSNAEDFTKMGFSPGMFWGTIVAFVEFFGGIAMLLGFYAEIAALAFGFEMLLGFSWKISKGRKFSDFSYDLLLLTLTLMLLTFGTGFFAARSL